MTYEEALKKCDGECDYCKFKSIVKGTDERIDREPVYYCSLFDYENGAFKFVNLANTEKDYIDYIEKDIKTIGDFQK